MVENGSFNTTINKDEDHFEFRRVSITIKNYFPVNEVSQTYIKNSKF